MPTTDEYLDEVRSGKVAPRWALQQLRDEFPTAQSCVTRIRNVVSVLGHEGEAAEAQELLLQLGKLSDRVERLLSKQIIADKDAYRAKLASSFDELDG